MSARVGIPEEVLMANGSNFVSKTMRDYCTTMGIEQIKTSPYHPQTNGMVERFNATLKRLLLKLTQNPKVEGDECLPYVLCAYRGTVHKTTGFSPYQMSYGRPMRMPLDQMVRYWRGKEEQGQNTTIEFVETLRDLAYKKEIKEKESQKFYHNRKSLVRSSDVGEYVLVFRPIRKSKLENQWQSPYIISKKLTEVTYQIDLGTFGKRHGTFHVNCMRKWTSPTPAAFMALDEEDINHEKEDTHIMQTSHHMESEKLKNQFKDVLQDVPGRTTLVHHKIPTQDAPPIPLPPYRLAHHSKEFLRAEIQTLLKQGIIEPSSSPWAAPIVLVAKKDGSQHMCVDYRKLNAITIGDPYPLPHIEELINGIGASKFITTLDLTKGYYQVPVAPEHKDKGYYQVPVAPEHKDKGYHQVPVAPEDKDKGYYQVPVAPEHKDKGSHQVPVAPEHKDKGYYQVPVAPEHKDKGHHQVPVAPEHKDKGYYQVPVASEYKDKGYYQVPVAPEHKDKGYHQVPVAPEHKDKGYHQVPVAPEHKDKEYHQVPVAPEHKDKGYYQVPVAPEDKDKGYHQVPVAPELKDKEYHQVPVAPEHKDKGHHQVPVAPEHKDKGYHQVPPPSPSSP